MQRHLARSLVHAMRPHHWIKNLLIFLPLISAHRVLDGQAWAEGIRAFWGFSFAASSVYLFNDWVDRETDRLHPDKKRRPIASGAVKPKWAIGLSVLLAVGSIGISWPLPLPFLKLLGAYLLLNLAYSLAFKKLVLLDVLALAGFYVIRVIGGGWATSTAITNWFLMFCLFFFLSLALAKRTTEVFQLRGELAKQGRGYVRGDRETLLMLGVSSAFASVLILSLYLSSSSVRSLYLSSGRLWLLVPLVLYWKMRLWIQTARGELESDPILSVVKDPVSYLLSFLFLGIVWWAS